MFLFRPQSLRSQDHLHGDVNLAQPLSWRLLTFSAALLVVVLVIFGSIYKMKDVVVYRGHVDTEDMTYSFSVKQGRVMKLSGSHVAKHDILAETLEGKIISPFDGVFYEENGSYKLRPVSSRYRLKLEIPSNKANDYLGKRERFVFDKGSSVEAVLVTISDDFHVKEGINYVYVYSSYIDPVGYKVAPGMSVMFEAEIGEKPIISMLFS